jgi:DNA-binding transcriptional ArsR family regulator
MTAEEMARLDIPGHTFKSVPMAAHPTLWRTCRVLANRRRLRLLADLGQHPYASVSDVARRLALPVCIASQYLRALNARGLIGAQRSGRFVCYHLAADPDVHGAAELSEALARALSHGVRKLEPTFRELTAFTHPRRVQIVRVLSGGPLTKEKLRARTRISRRALRRHLRKLAQRRVLTLIGRAYRLHRPKGPLAAALLRLAREEQGGRPHF